MGAPPDELLVYNASAITGVLPYSRLTEGVQPVMIDTDARVLELHRDHLREMATSCHELTTAFVQQMTDRVRNFTQQAQQEEKLASLGRLSAGLAHELKTPFRPLYATPTLCAATCWPRRNGSRKLFT